jgi:hypothetical protein
VKQCHWCRISKNIREETAIEGKRKKRRSKQKTPGIKRHRKPKRDQKTKEMATRPEGQNEKHRATQGKRKEEMLLKRADNRKKS